MSTLTWRDHFCRVAAVAGFVAFSGVKAVMAGGIVVPSGVDGARLDLIARGETVKVSVALFAVDGGQNPLPPDWLATVGSKEQLTERFVKKVEAAGRFKIFDSRYAIEKPDVEVSGNFLETSQLVVPKGSGFKALTTVNLSLAITDTLTSERDADSCKESRFTYGDTAGVGARAANRNELDSEGFRMAKEQDRLEAIEQVLETAAYCLMARIRPVTKVLKASGDTVDLYGGKAHGLEAGDSLVVFAATPMQIGSKQVYTYQPVAKIECPSVGKDVSRCGIIGRVKGAPQVSAEHFAILSDESLNKRFE